MELSQFTFYSHLSTELQAFVHNHARLRPYRNDPRANRNTVGNFSRRDQPPPQRFGAQRESTARARSDRKIIKER